MKLQVNRNRKKKVSRNGIVMNETPWVTIDSIILHWTLWRVQEPINSTNRWNFRVQVTYWLANRVMRAPIALSFRTPWLLFAVEGGVGWGEWERCALPLTPRLVRSCCTTRSSWPQVSKPMSIVVSWAAIFLSCCVAFAPLLIIAATHDNTSGTIEGIYRELLPQTPSQ